MPSRLRPFWFCAPGAFSSLGPHMQQVAHMGTPVAAGITSHNRSLMTIPIEFGAKIEHFVADWLCPLASARFGFARPGRFLHWDPTCNKLHTWVPRSLQALLHTIDP